MSDYSVYRWENEKKPWQYEVLVTSKIPNFEKKNRRTVTGCGARVVMVLVVVVVVVVTFSFTLIVLNK